MMLAEKGEASHPSKISKMKRSLLIFCASLSLASGFLPITSAPRRTESRPSASSDLQTQRSRRRQPHLSLMRHVRPSSLRESTFGTSPKFVGNSDSDNEDMERRTRQLVAHSDRIKTLRLANATTEELLLSFDAFHNFIAKYHYQADDSSSIVQKTDHHDALTDVAVQAIRAAAKIRDYRSIIRVMDNCIQYANLHPILSPRIFGEGVTALSKTRANISKLKYAWRLVAAKNVPYLQAPVSAFELSVMIDALAKRGTVRACLELVDRHIAAAESESEAHGDFEPAPIEPDAFTASAIFTMLADSVTENQTAVPPLKLSKDATSFQISLARLDHSSYWQWNKVIELLNHLPPESEWNNHVYSALLGLHYRIVSVDEQPQPDSVKMALTILQNMAKNKCWPSVVTCTIAMKIIRTVSTTTSWQVAIVLLDRMISHDDLPYPNVYTYTEAIAACARSNQYLMAKQLLQDMRTGTSSIGNRTDFTPPSPNTWVYNAVLLAIANLESTQKKGMTEHHSNRQKTLEEQKCELALDLLDQMKTDCKNAGFDTCPDNVTYNTILSIFGSAQFRGAAIGDRKVIILLNDMIESDINADTITYCAAMSAMSGGKPVVRLLQNAVQDTSVKDDAENLLSVFNAALSSLATCGDESSLRAVIEMMRQHKVEYNEETVSQLIKAYIGCSNSPDVPLLISALDRKNRTSVFSRQKMYEEHSINLDQLELPSFRIKHYSSAIGACLGNNDLEQARRILNDMRSKGHSPKPDCLESFALVYAGLAQKMVLESCKNDLSQIEHNQDAQSRARSAQSILMLLERPPHHIMCAVANACAKTGLWKNAHQTIEVFHNDIVTSYKDSVKLRQRSIDLLFGLHRTLLVQCAKQGNIKEALRIVDSVTKLRARMKCMERGSSDTAFVSSPSERRTSNPFSSMLGSTSTVAKELPDFGSKDWVLLLTAAQRSGHWRVCLTTLQFLKPFVERCHPARAVSREDEIRLRVEYKKIAPALAIAVKCFELRSQYGWAVRAIEDWIEWSGRRPHSEAVSAATRVLCSRKRGEEVSALMTRCLFVLRHKEGSEASEYDNRVCAAAITSLYRAKLHESADEVFEMALSRGCDFLNLTSTPDNAQPVLDLRGLNVALAHSALRSALQRREDADRELGLMILTGRSEKRSVPMRPILRSQTQNMLQKQFVPPLTAAHVPKNSGALLLSEENIEAWRIHQLEQKDARILAVAAALKSLSGGRLRKSMKKVARRQNPASEPISDSANAPTEEE